MLKFQWISAILCDMMILRSGRNIFGLNFKKKGGCYPVSTKNIFKELGQEFEKIDYLRNRITHPEYQMREVVIGKKEQEYDLRRVRVAPSQDTGR
jgi:hypothetical protein